MIMDGEQRKTMNKTTTKIRRVKLELTLLKRKIERQKRIVKYECPCGSKLIEKRRTYKFYGNTVRRRTMYCPKCEKWRNSGNAVISQQRRELWAEQKALQTKIKELKRE